MGHLFSQKKGYIIVKYMVGAPDFGRCPYSQPKKGQEYPKPKHLSFGS